VFPDADAVYESVVRIDVSSLAPIVVVSPSPANTRDLMTTSALKSTRAISAPVPAVALRANADVLKSMNAIDRYPPEINPFRASARASSGRVDSPRLQ
jgi:homoaconitase/3-isopropylmalate dehydratase large subunit